MVWKRSIQPVFVLLLSGGMVLSAILQLIDLSNLTYSFLYDVRLVRISFIEPSVWAAQSILLAVVLLLPNPRNVLGYMPLMVLSVVALGGPVMVFSKAFPSVWIVVSSSALIASLLIRRPNVVGASRKEVLRFWVVEALLLFLLVELAALAVWIQHAMASSLPFQGAFHWRWTEVSLGLFYSGYQAAPYLVLLLFSSWAWIPPLVWIARSRGGSTPYIGLRIQLPTYLSRRTGLYCLLVLLGLCAFLGAYAILATGVPIGADARKYIPFLRSPPDLILASARDLLAWNARGGYIIFLYGLKEVTGLSPEATFNIQPILYAFLLSCTVFYLVRSTTGDNGLALLSGVFTIFSGQSVVAMLYGAYPNWLAMAELTAFLSFNVLSQMRRRWRYAILAQIAVLSLLVTHYWTWGAGLAVLAIYIVISALGGLHARGHGLIEILKFPTAILSINILLAYYFLPIAYGSDITFRQVFTGSARHYPELKATYLGEVASTVLHYLARPRLDSLSWTLNYSLNQVAAGFFNQSWLFLVALIGLYFLLRRGGHLGQLMLSWTIFSFLATLLIDPFLHWRIMFIYPMGIMLAAGTLGLANFLGERFRGITRPCVAFLLVVITMNYSLASIAYLSILMPSLSA